jgi:hypothetical protein
VGKIAKPLEFIIGDELVRAVLVGGYPEMLRRKNQERRRAWARDYIKAIVERDIRDIADLEKLVQMPRLLQPLARILEDAENELPPTLRCLLADLWNDLKGLEIRIEETHWRFKEQFRQATRRDA